MMTAFLVIISSVISSLTSLPANTGVCSGEGQICQIPYLYSGQLHFQCSTQAPGGEQDHRGRCPVRLLDQDTREASDQPSDWVVCGASCPLQRYTENAEIENHLADLVEEFPHLANLVEVGNSTLGQPIVGIQISRGVQGERELLKPKVRYSGNMHGNEPVGREMLNHFAEVLLRGYGLIDVITKLVNETDITLIPTMNPDGFDRGQEGACSGANYKTGRFNEGNRDLNRDFPTWRDINSSVEDLFVNRQPETQAMMRLILSEPWVLSANFHDGAVVASYPYDDYHTDDFLSQRGISYTPDHRFFKHLASTYAVNHRTMMNQSVCERWWFDDGITNGADWYPLNGGLQDFNYVFSNDMEITLELSCCKYPSRSRLNREWDINKESLVKYLQQVHRGVKGVVYDSSYDQDNFTAGSAVASAVISVETVSGHLGKNVTTSSKGEFWRLLLPGQYSVTAYKDVCSTGGVILHSQTVNITITEENPLVVQNFVLDMVVPCGNGPRGKTKSPERERNDQKTNEPEFSPVCTIMAVFFSNLSC